MIGGQVVFEAGTIVQKPAVRLEILERIAARRDGVLLSVGKVIQSHPSSDFAKLWPGKQLWLSGLYDITSDDI